jgi:electron transfer flavoprotein beta subunit
LNIVVLVKQVPDMNAVKIDRASGKPVLSGQLVVNSFDEYAIEEAIRLRDAHGGEVTVVCAGPQSAKDAITRALAMGADKGVHLLTNDTAAVDTLALASALAGALKGLSFDLILLGQNSDDSTTGHVGPQLAELLGLPSVSSVTELSVSGNHITAARDTEDGRQTVELDLPAVILAMTGLNEPRYPSLKGIMAAKKKPIEQTPLTIEAAPDRVTWGEPFVPERTVQGVILQDVPAADAAKQLVAWLKEHKLV